MYLSGKYISMDVLCLCGIFPHYRSFRLLKTELVLYNDSIQNVLIATQNFLKTKRLKLHQYQKKKFQEIFSSHKKNDSQNNIPHLWYLN